VVEEVVDGTGESIARRLSYAYVDATGRVTPAGPAPYLDCVAAPRTPAVAAAIKLARLDEAESNAQSWIISHQLKAYLADVSARHLPKVERMRLRVDQRLSQESRRLDDEAKVAQEQEEKGIKPRESSDSLWHKAQDLQARREARLALLEKQAQLGTSPPRIVTAALVLPLSLVETEIPSDSPIHATEKVALKRRGIDLVLAAERELGREPQVQACGYPGYDIASFPHNGGASIRIVVK